MAHEMTQLQGSQQLTRKRKRNDFITVIHAKFENADNAEQATKTMRHESLWFELHYVLLPRQDVERPHQFKLLIPEIAKWHHVNGLGGFQLLYDIEVLPRIMFRNSYA
ncbi:hypothetical protein VNO80_19229 [Phaseolus coccineus]|uniref:Uncharacterized protein n=1 Tax=Phaseolus coccineus TaxID=3886 RepID=A0AAN9QZK9_PHACN